jgi:hypothetical protein
LTEFGAGMRPPQGVDRHFFSAPKGGTKGKGTRRNKQQMGIAVGVMSDKEREQYERQKVSKKVYAQNKSISERSMRQETQKRLRRQKNAK